MAQNYLSELESVLTQFEKTLTTTSFRQHWRSLDPNFIMDFKTRHPVKSNRINQEIRLLYQTELRITALKLADSFFKTNKQKLRPAILSFLKNFSWKKHSEKSLFIDEIIDRMLGLSETRVKQKVLLTPGNQPRSYYREYIYIENASHELYTPYWTIDNLLSHLNKHKNTTIVDLGSGLGRMGIYIGLFFPNIQYFGLELMSERVQQCRETAASLRLKKVHYMELNLAKSPQSIPDASHYYLFNPFSPSTLKTVLLELKTRRKKSKPFHIISAAIGIPKRKLPKENWIKKTGVLRSLSSWKADHLEIYKTQ